MDCIDGMRQLPDKCFDLVIADPPYNLSKGNNWKWDGSVRLPGFGGVWNKMMESWDNLAFDDYWSFSASWIAEARRVLKPTGSIWVYGTYHNVGIINVLFQILGIEIINEIIWFKPNAFPNLSGRRFTASHENLIWGHVGGKRRRYFFNYDFTKEAFPEDCFKRSGKQMRTVWAIPNNKTKEETTFGRMPSQKPLALDNRVIQSTTRPNDIILVPFAGVGSECVSAKLLRRRFIGFEINSRHVEIARKRIAFAEKSLKQTKLLVEGIA